MTFNVDWSTVDNVLLDMDGTLLDLHFDATFWLTSIHATVSANTGESEQSIRERFLSELAKHEGSLTWYCTDYWTKFFKCNVIDEKKKLKHLIRSRPHTIEFLEALKASDRRALIVTNAHRDVIKLKLDIVPIELLVDSIVSSHDFGVPKEDQSFWSQFFESHKINPNRSLFLDDSPAVLEAASEAGIAQVAEIRHPNLSEPPRALWRHGIEDFDAIIPSLRAIIE